MINQWASYLAVYSAGFGSVCTGTTIGASLFSSSKNDIWGTISIYVGASISSLISGKLCDVFGRKTISLLSVGPLIMGWTFIIFIPNSPSAIVAGRLIAGTACGIMSVSLPMYSTEIAPKSQRGRFGCQYQLGSSIGATIAYATSMLLEKPLALHIICITLPIIYICLYYPQLQSPIQQLRKGKEESAKLTLQKLRGKRTDISEEFEIFKEYARESTKLYILYEKLVEVHTKKAMFICIFLNIFQSLSGIKLCLKRTKKFVYIPKNPISDQNFIIFFIVIQLISNVLCMNIVDISGRRCLLKYSSIGISLSLGLLGISNTVFFHKLVDIENDAWYNYAASFSVLGLVFAYNVGIGPITYFYAAELTSPEMKSFVMAISSTINWLFVVGLMLEDYYFQAMMGLDVNVFLLFGISIVSILFIQFFVIETKKKNFKEVHEAVQKRKVKNLYRPTIYKRH